MVGDTSPAVDAVVSPPLSQWPAGSIVRRTGGGGMESIGGTGCGRDMCGRAACAMNIDSRPSLPLFLSKRLLMLVSDFMRSHSFSSDLVSGGVQLQVRSSQDHAVQGEDLCAVDICVFVFWACLYHAYY